MARNINLEVDQGADFDQTINISSQIPDLTGFSFRGQIRRSFDSRTYITLDCAIRLPETDGQINVSIPNTSTLEMTGRYFFTVEAIAPDTTVTRVVEGQVFTSPGTVKP